MNNFPFTSQLSLTLCGSFIQNPNEIYSNLWMLGVGWKETPRIRGLSCKKKKKKA